MTDGSGTVGVRGVIGGEWFYDVSAGYGHNRFDFTVVNSLNASLGPNVPPNQTEFDSGGLAFDQFVVNAGRLARRRRRPRRAAERGVRRGVPARELPDRRGRAELVRATAARATSSAACAALGAQVFPGFRPSNEVDASRNSFAGYLDLEGDVHAKVRLGLAGRVEHYSDFGSTADGKITARLLAHQTLRHPRRGQHRLPRARRWPRRTSRPSARTSSP